MITAPNGKTCGSSMPIDPSVILREAGISEEEIQGIEESNQAFSLPNTARFFAEKNSPCNSVIRF